MTTGHVQTLVHGQANATGTVSSRPQMDDTLSDLMSSPIPNIQVAPNPPVPSSSSSIRSIPYVICKVVKVLQVLHGLLSSSVVMNLIMISLVNKGYLWITLIFASVGRTQSRLRVLNIIDQDVAKNTSRLVLNVGVQKHIIQLWSISYKSTSPSEGLAKFTQ